MRQAVRTLGLEIRAGLHAGECELVGDTVGGIAVHIGARVMAKAGADEVLVSSTVKDLVVRSGIKFKDRGAHRLKGLREEWRPAKCTFFTRLMGEYRKLRLPGGASRIRTRERPSSGPDETACATAHR
jgi:hypothetical protein